MKTIFITLLLILGLSALSTAQEESFNDFRREFNHRDGVHCFTVPGFLVRLVGGIALKNEDFIEREALRPLIRNMASVSILISEEESRMDNRDIQELLSRLHDEDYETLLKVRDDGDNIEVLSWSKKDVIKRLVLVIQEEQVETILINIRGHFRQEDIDEMIDKLERKNRLERF